MENAEQQHNNQLGRKSFSPIIWIDDFPLAMGLVETFPDMILGVSSDGGEPREWLFRNSLDIEMYIHAFKNSEAEWSEQ